MPKASTRWRKLMLCEATELRHGGCCGAVWKAVSSAIPILNLIRCLTICAENASLPKSRRRRAKDTNSSKRDSSEGPKQPGVISPLQRSFLHIEQVFWH